MAKISGKYETIFIVNPKLEEAAATAVVDKFKSLVEANGTNVEVEDWGKRRLAYPIEDQTEGGFVSPKETSSQFTSIAVRLLPF